LNIIANEKKYVNRYPGKIKRKKLKFPIDFWAGNEYHSIRSEAHTTEYHMIYAGMAELADAHGSGPCEHCAHEGSSPSSCIFFVINLQ
jgi:hypothetical protein